jgi:hypothetical protein
MPCDIEVRRHDLARLSNLPVVRDDPVADQCRFPFRARGLAIERLTGKDKGVFGGELGCGELRSPQSGHDTVDESGMVGRHLLGAKEEALRVADPTRTAGAIISRRLNVKKRFLGQSRLEVSARLSSSVEPWSWA